MKVSLTVNKTRMSPISNVGLARLHYLLTLVTELLDLNNFGFKLSKLCFPFTF